MKLYYFQKRLEVMFISDKPEEDLYDEAEYFLKKDQKESGKPSTTYTLKEVQSLKDIPDGWKTAFVWTRNQKFDDMTAKEFYDQHITVDPEYREYLRLKKKFDNL